MSSKVTDKRFAHVHTDPRFRKQKSLYKPTATQSTTPKQDDRFNAMYTDKQFNSDVVVDRFGAVRKLKSNKPTDNTSTTTQTHTTTNNQHSSDSEAVSGESDIEGNVLSTREMAGPSSDDNSDSYNDVDNDLFSGSDVEYATPNTVQYAAYHGFSHSDSDNSEIDETELMNDTVRNEEQIDTTDTTTHRLAICNLEWDRITAADIYVMLHQFVSSDTGTLNNVTIYVSEYGKQKLAEEERYGPQLHDDVAEIERKKAEIEAKAQEFELKQQQQAESVVTEDHSDNDNDVSESDTDDEEILEQLLNPADDDVGDGTDLQPIEVEKLRNYELDRLKYYYCIVECSNIETAEHLYKQCDGLEFESTANLLDIRFVPNDTVFDPVDIHSECDTMPNNYKAPNTFFTRALQHTKVELNWDKSDAQRDTILRDQWNTVLGHNKQHKKGTMNNDDISAYIAGATDGGAESDAYLTDAIVETSDSEATGIEDSGYESSVRRGKKRVLLKRRARARYSVLLDEIKEMKNEFNESTINERTIVYNPEIQKLTERLNNGDSENMTVWDKVLAKRKAKKQAKKLAQSSHSEVEQNNENNNNDQPFSDDDIDEDDQPFSDDINTDSDIEQEQITPKNKKTDKKHKSKKPVLTETEQQQQKQSAAELELLMLNDNNEQKQEQQGYSLKALLKQQRAKQKQQAKQTNKHKQIDIVPDNVDTTTESNIFKINLNDERFKPLFTDPQYHIDKTDKYYKSTPGTEQIVEYRQKQRLADLESQANTVKQQKQKLQQNSSNSDSTELKSLVDSVKRKSAVATNKLEKNKRIKM